MIEINNEEQSWVEYLCRQYIKEMYRYHPECRYHYGIIMCSQLIDKFRNKKDMVLGIEQDIGVLP